MREERGITLVSLVVTIIILLILATVSISLIINGGIIDKTKSAVDKYSEAEIGEQIKLAYLECETEKLYNSNVDEKNFLKESLDKIFGTNSVTVTESKGVYTISFINGKSYLYNPKIEQLEEIVWIQTGNTVTNNRTGQICNVGDTIYYNSGVEEYENQGQWGILGAEDGKLLIVSTKTVARVTLSGKEGYNNGKNLLDNACSSFKNELYANSVRSITVEDINKATGYVVPVGATHSYTMTDDGFVKMDNDASTTVKKFEDINGKKLPEDSPILVTDIYYSYFLSTGKVKNLLLDNNSDFYFLASPCISSSSDEAKWGLQIFGNNCINSHNFLYSSKGSSWNQTTGVRAVVYLKSNMQLKGDSTNGWTIEC